MRKAAAAGTRFFIEAVISLVAGVLGLTTIFWSDWIELVFRVDPDRGSGALEVGLVVALLAAAMTAGLLARRYLRTLRVS